MKALQKTDFGNSILRAKAHKLSQTDIKSSEVQDLIKAIRFTLQKRKFGIGLAAPQVGVSKALAVIRIRPTKMRPKLPKSEWADVVIINPQVVSTAGEKIYWEGCISLPGVYAKVPRYKTVKVKYTNEHAKTIQKEFHGRLAHVIQHEIDHLKGILFVDKVQDRSSFMTESEYKKQIVDKGVNQYE